jgi:hypothetical protein
MFTLSQIKTAFKTPLTTFKNGAVIQRQLLALCASSDQDLATTRALSLLEATELRTLFLSQYPEVKISVEEKNTSADIKMIHNGLLPFKNISKKAVQELYSKIPKETVDLLVDYLRTESPLYFIAVNTFTVVAMVLIESGEI